MQRTKQQDRTLKALFWTFLMFWGLLAVRPNHRSDWLLESVLVFVAVPALFFFYRKLPLSMLSYWLIFVFLVLHTIGSHYTYAEVPAGRMVSDWLGLERNHYDRLVHFMWGFLLTIPVFEMLRKRVGRKVAPVFGFACCILVVTGVLYELMEWAAAAIVAPDTGAAYLGIQGDEWDAQKDLLMNTLGAVAAAVFLPFAVKKPAVANN